MWEFCQGVGGAGWVLFWSKIGWRPSEARYLIDVVNQQMDQLHEIDWALDRETACAGNWLFDTGMMEHRALSLGVLRKDRVNKGVWRVSGGNEQGREHKIVSVNHANSRFYDRRTLDGITTEGSAISFDTGIITDAMRAIDGWRCWRVIITKYGFMRRRSENRWELAEIL